MSLNHRLSEGCPGQGSSEFSGPSSKQLVTESLSFPDLGQESKVDLTHLAGDCDVGCKPNGWKSKSVPSSPENLHQVICSATAGGAKSLELIRSTLKDQSGNSTPLQRGLVSDCLWRATISIKSSKHCLCNCSKLTPRTSIKHGVSRGSKSTKHPFTPSHRQENPIPSFKTHATCKESEVNFANQSVFKNKQNPHSEEMHLQLGGVQRTAPNSH